MSFIADNRRYDRMVYRRCGRHGLQLPAISLGLWQNFGDSRPLDEVSAMLTRAFDLGVTHFDLANNYGPAPGAAESNFGQVISRELSAYRDELVISTKAGYDMGPGPYGDGGSRKYMLASLDASLRRMKLDYVDIFYSHRFDPDTPMEETMGALNTAVQRGKALYVGISNYPPKQALEAAGILVGLGTPLLILQPAYSMLNRWMEHGLLDTISEVGAGCIVYSPLEQGILTDRYLDGVPAGSRASQAETLHSAQLDGDTLSKVRALSQIAQRRGQTMAQMALAWTQRDPRVTSTLVGASSLAQLEQNVATIDALAFSEGEMEEIEAILKP
jgi:L-glyceraldehyde 3-phosphate reductase